jgi:hypothetical protein
LIIGVRPAGHGLLTRRARVFSIADDNPEVRPFVAPAGELAAELHSTEEEMHTHHEVDFSTDVHGLEEAKSPEAIRLRDGDTHEITIKSVRKRIGDAEVRMLGYTGSISGPTLHMVPPTSRSQNSKRALTSYALSTETRFVRSLRPPSASSQRRGRRHPR